MRRVRLAVSTSLGLFLLLLITMAVEAGDDSYAEQLLKTARGYDPMYTTTPNRDRAIELYRQVLRERSGNPESIRIEFRIGNMLLNDYNEEKGGKLRKEKAFKVFKAITQKYSPRYPEYAYAYLCIGEYHRERNEYEEAKSAYMRVIDISPDAVDEAPKSRADMLWAKECAAGKIIDMLINGESSVTAVIKLNDFIGRYRSTVLAKVAEKTVEGIVRRDRRNVCEIAEMEKQVIEEIVRSQGNSANLDERYVAEIDKLEKELLPVTSQRQVKKEMMITTQEAIAAMEEEVLRASEKAIEK